LQPMPSESGAQHAFMEMSKTAKGRAQLKAHGKEPAPKAVASEFSSADRGKHFKNHYKKKAS